MSLNDVCLECGHESHFHDDESGCDLCNGLCPAFASMQSALAERVAPAPEAQEQEREPMCPHCRSHAEDAFFAGVLHGEKRNNVPIHKAFDAWWPKEAK